MKQLPNFYDFIERFYPAPGSKDDQGFNRNTCAEFVEGVLQDDCLGPPADIAERPAFLPMPPPNKSVFLLSAEFRFIRAKAYPHPSHPPEAISISKNGRSWIARCTVCKHQTTVKNYFSELDTVYFWKHGCNKLC